MAQILAFNSKTASGIGTSAAPVFDASPTDGNTLIAVVSTATVTTDRVTSISQTGATWTKVIGSEAAQTDINLEVWKAYNVSGAGTTVTINLASSLTYIVNIFECSGVVSASGIDVVKPGNATSASSPVTKALTTATVAQQVELLLFAEVSTSAISSTPAIPSGYTSIYASGGGSGLQMATGYRIRADTVGTEAITASASGSPTLNLIAIVFSLKAALNKLALRAGSAVSSTGSGATLTLTLAKTPLNGNTVFVGTTSLTTAGIVTNVTGTNITFTKDVQENSLAPALTIWRGGVKSGASTTITIASNSVETCACGAEYFGVMYNGIDVSATNTGNSTNPSTGTTGTTAQANELAIGVLADSIHQAPGSSTATFTDLKDQLGAVTTGMSLVASILQSVGTTTCVGSIFGGGPWAGAIATYKEGAPLPGGLYKAPLKAGGIIMLKG